MLCLPSPYALLADWRAMQTSMGAAHLPLRLPEQPQTPEAFWAALPVATGPLHHLGAALAPLESSAAGTVSRFAFPSPVVSADEENNQVVGRLYSPAAARQEAPFLLLLHANGRQDWGFEDWHARRLMARRWRVALLALPYHLERRPARLDPGAAVMTPDLPHTLLALGQAACDAAAVLRWARAAGAGRVAVAGWSLGGLVAALVATQLPLDAALLVEPAANLAWMMTHYGLFPAAIRRELRAAGLTQAALEDWLAPVLPGNLRPQVPLAGLRFLLARYDRPVGFAPPLALWRAWGRPALRIEPTGHVALLVGPALARELDEITRGG